MRYLVNLWLRLKALVLRRRLERDLEAELSFHLAMRETEYAASGVAGAAAQEAARRRFGNPTQYKEQLRDMWTFPSFESIWQDVRYALRTLRKAPGFTIVAVFALALGIGGNTAIFSLVDSIRLRALPYAHAERLVVLWGNVMRARVERRGASYPDFLDWRAQATSFDGMAAFDNTRMTLSGVDEARRIVVEIVSAPYFLLLGIDVAHGRTFLASEDVVPQKIAVTVLADGFWKRQFGGDPQIIGRTILLNAQPFTVVGIMPAGFRGLTDSADVWIPFVMSDTAEGLAQRGTRGFQVLARLKPGVAIAQAQTELDAISRRLEQAYPETNEKRAVEISPLDVEMFGPFRPALAMLMAAVGFVLLIACANVANLLIARSEARQREIAVRTALGAGWPRLLRQLITESCVLTSLGAVAGLVLAKASIRALVSASPIDFPSFVDPHVDLRVAAFTVVVSLGCGLLLGLAPALHGRVSRLADALKDTARGSDGRRSQRLRSALVVAEVSLAVVLLVGAGLMIHSVQKLTTLDPGFDPESVLTLRVSIPRAAASPSADAANASPPPFVVSARTLLERARAIPGVVTASITSDAPLSGLNSAIFYTAEGQPPVTAQNRPRAYVHRITPDFFNTMRIPIRQGRTFAENESSPDARVVVVSERVATRFWPGQDAIGKRIKTGGATANSPWLSIVGVVAEVKYRGLPENPTADPDLYFPFLDGNQQVSLVLRTSVPPATIAPAARAAIREVDSTIPVFSVATMAELVSSQTSQLRFTTWLMGFFAAVALLLASVGIYGVMSYLVTQRTREIGIRLALGATASDILRLIVGNGALLIVTGIVIGIAASFGLAQLVKALLFSVTAADAATGIAVAVLAGVSLAACYLPALRASRVDPLVALHYE